MILNVLLRICSFDLTTQTATVKSSQLAVYVYNKGYYANVWYGSYCLLEIIELSKKRALQYCNTKRWQQIIKTVRGHTKNRRKIFQRRVRVRSRPGLCETSFWPFVIFFPSILDGELSLFTICSQILCWRGYIIIPALFFFTSKPSFLHACPRPA